MFVNLSLNCEGVRIPMAKGVKKDALNDYVARNDYVAKKITKHHIANSILVICGHYPMLAVPSVDNEIYLSEKKSQNKIYNEIVEGQVNVSFNFFDSHIETISGFKRSKPFNQEYDTYPAKNGKWSPAPTGFFNKSMFKNMVAGKADSNTVNEFHNWLANRYEDESGTFGNLLSMFEQEVFHQEKDKRASYAKSILPSKFHIFNFFLKDSYHSGKLSKYTTQPYLVKADGAIENCKQGGLVVTRGGPVLMVHTNFKLDIEMPVSLHSMIMRDTIGGPGYATIGDGGLCYIEED